MKYRKAEDVVKREIAGEVFLVPVKHKLADMQNLFVLHGCGEFIWDCLDSAADRDCIAELLADSYNVASDEAIRDVDKFLSALLEASLIKAAV